jgi:hypothetical protein
LTQLSAFEHWLWRSIEGSSQKADQQGDDQDFTTLLLLV